MRLALSVVKLFAYYLLLFAVCRSVFLFYFFFEISEEGFGILFQSLRHAISLDVSAACYLLFVPLLLLVGAPWDKDRWLTKTLKGYLAVTTVIVVLLSMCEIGVYREMHVKLYFNLLSHLAHPDELFHSVSYGLIFITLLLTALISFLFIHSFRFFISDDFALNKSREKLSVIR